MNSITEKCHCLCGCEELATTTDEHQVPVCEACSEYVINKWGDVICSRQWSQCIRDYQHNIVEHGIETHGPGKPNTQFRFCARCGAEWHLEERGRDNWVVVSFEAGDEDELEHQDEDEFGACQGGCDEQE